MTTPTLWVLDRFEDHGRAILLAESGEERTVPRAALGPDAKEGDALREVRDDGAARYRVDVDATERLRKEAEDLRSSLRRGPSGPMSL